MDETECLLSLFARWEIGHSCCPKLTLDINTAKAFVKAVGRDNYVRVKLLFVAVYKSSQPKTVFALLYIKVWSSI